MKSRWNSQCMYLLEHFPHDFMSNASYVEDNSLVWFPFDKDWLESWVYCDCDIVTLVGRITWPWWSPLSWGSSPGTLLHPWMVRTMSDLLLIGQLTRPLMGCWWHCLAWSASLAAVWALWCAGRCLAEEPSSLTHLQSLHCDVTFIYVNKTDYIRLRLTYLLS